jgi:hypothetical protein
MAKRSKYINGDNNSNEGKIFFQVFEIKLHAHDDYSYY